MSRHMKGCYIDLLVAQFNSGPLSLEEIKIVLGADFAVWGSLSKKFKQTGNGLFFNERLEAEKTKRAEYSLKQKERVNKRWNKPGTHFGNTTVLPSENENRNKVKNVVEEKKESRENVSRGTIDIDFAQPDVPGEELIFPVDTKPIRQLWAKWKQHRHVNFSQRYSMYGEQSDLDRLQGLSPPEIEQTILAAISNNWKNLYPEKKQRYAQTSRTLTATSPEPGKDYSERF